MTDFLHSASQDAEPGQPAELMFRQYCAQVLPEPGVTPDSVLSPAETQRTSTIEETITST